MIQIVITITGEEIIGNLNERLTSAEPYTILNPMYIIGRQDEYGVNAMRLRNVLLLSDEDSITFPGHNIVATYKPSEKMSQYYDKAVEFDQKYGRPEIEGQLAAAIVALEETSKDEDERMKSLSQLISKLAGQRKLH